jgi:hypothetical protein
LDSGARKLIDPDAGWRQSQSRLQRLKIALATVGVNCSHVGQTLACLLLVFSVLAEVKTRQAEACPTRIP